MREISTVYQVTRYSTWYSQILYRYSYRYRYRYKVQYSHTKKSTTIQ